VTKRLGITHGDMNAAIDQGHAVPLSRSNGWLMRYDGDWWIEWEQGWLRVTDDDTTRDLDMIAERLAAAGAIAAQGPAERTASAADPTDGGDDVAGVKRRIADLGRPARRTRPGSA
jgi:hypothetical protein